MNSNRTHRVQGCPARPLQKEGASRQPVTTPSKFASFVVSSSAVEQHCINNRTANFANHANCLERLDRSGATASEKEL